MFGWGQEIGSGLRFCALRYMCETKHRRFNKRQIGGNEEGAEVFSGNGNGVTI